MRELSGVDGMHGRRLGDLFECGPDRRAVSALMPFFVSNRRIRTGEATVLYTHLRRKAVVHVVIEPTPFGLVPESGSHRSQERSTQEH